MKNLRTILAALTVITFGYSATAQLTDSTICEGNSIVLTPQNTGFSYSWSTGETTSSIQVNTAGTYFVEVDFGEVFDHDTMTLSVNPMPVPVKGDTMVCSGELLTIDPGFYDAYLWGEAAGNSTERELEVPAIANWTLDLTVWDANGCSRMDTVYILASQAMDLVLDSGTTSCFGDSSGWASVGVISGGIAPFTYLWGNGATQDTITWVPAQAYSIEVTDAAGCKALEDVLVTEGPSAALGASVMSSDAVCNGPHGAATVMAFEGTAPYTYLWADGQTDSIASALLPGVHHVTVSDFWLCKKETSVLVANENENIDLEVSSTNSSCGQANGSIQANPAGGYVPYSYAWDNGATTKIKSLMSAGLHSVTVTDSLGCVETATGGISDDEAPVLVTDSITTSVCSQQDGAVHVSTTGGTAPLTYNWSSGASTEDLVKVGPGKYFLEISDNNNCVSAGVYTVSTDGSTAPKIGGTLNSSLNDSLIKDAKVTIVQDLQVAGVLPKFTSINVGANGQYVFDQVIVGDYILFVSPNTAVYEASFKTFYPNVSRWNEATSISAVCEDSTGADVNVIQKFVLNGKAKISGTITQQAKGLVNKTQGDPIPGIDVSLEQVPGGVVAQTETDENGIYLFDNVPPGTYGIHVDIPGLPMDSTYEVVIPVSQEDTIVGALDFLVDSTESVYIEPVVDGVSELVSQVHRMAVYPNPFQSQFTLAYQLSEKVAMDVKVYDVTGSVVASVLSADQAPGQYRYTVDLSDAVNGLYFIRINSNGHSVSHPVLMVE